MRMVAKAIVEAPMSAPFRHGLGAVLVGQDPRDPEARWGEMFEATRWYGRRGAVMHAIAAVDTALWDIAGQAAGRPCHALWGTQRQRIRAYASVLFPTRRKRRHGWPNAASPPASRRSSSAGVRSAATRRWDAETLGEIRRTVGEKVALMVDAGRCWTAEEALRRAPRLFDEFGLLWLEEPLNEDDIDGYWALCGGVNGRIAAGETEETEAFFERLIAAGVRVIQPDVGRCGGLTIARRLAARAHRSNSGACRIVSEPGSTSRPRCNGWRPRRRRRSMSIRSPKARSGTTS